MFDVDYQQLGWTYTRNSYGNYQWNYIVNHTAANGTYSNYGASNKPSSYSNGFKSNYVQDANSPVRQQWQASSLTMTMPIFG
jgi:hypothetical protein